MMYHINVIQTTYRHLYRSQGTHFHKHAKTLNSKGRDLKRKKSISNMIYRVLINKWAFLVKIDNSKCYFFVLIISSIHSHFNKTLGFIKLRKSLKIKTMSGNPKNNVTRGHHVFFQ